MLDFGNAEEACGLVLVLPVLVPWGGGEARGYLTDNLVGQLLVLQLSLIKGQVMILLSRCGLKAYRVSSIQEGCNSILLS